MKTRAMVFVSVLAAGAAYGQAIIEYGATIGRSAVAGAGAGTAAKSAVDALSKPKKDLNKAARTTTQRATQAAPAPAATTTTQPVSSNDPLAEQKPVIDPSAIRLGMDAEEVIRLFGKPSMRLTNTAGPDLTEKFWYRSPGYETVIITCKNGKVAAVSPDRLKPPELP